MPPPYHPDMTSLPVGDLLRLGLAGVPVTATACLDELALAAIVEGTPANPDALAHLTTCGRCRRRLAAAVVLLGDPEIVVALPSSRPRRSRRIPALLGVGALAATLLLVLFRPRAASGPEVLRDPALTAAAAPVLREPLGEVSSTQAHELVWSRVDGASSYRVTLFDSTGTVRFEEQLADTSVTLPDSLRLIPRFAYLWRVEARTEWERWSASSLHEFRIVPLPGPVPRIDRPAPATVPVPSPSSDELRVAFRAALAAGQWDEARKLAESYQVGWSDDFLNRELSRFLRWSTAQRSSKLWVDSVRLAGNAVYGRGGPLAAIAVWRPALTRALAIRDSSGSAALLGNIGAAFSREALPDSALSYLIRARQLAEAVGDRRVTANALSELAGVSEVRDPAAARDLYAQAVTLHQKIGDSRGLAADYNNLAALFRTAGDRDAARRRYEAALALNRAAGRSGPAATNLVNLAGLAAEVGAFGRAAADYQEALATWRLTADSAEMASALEGLGELSLRRGDYPQAQESFRSALSTVDRTGPAADAVRLRRRLAATLSAQGLLQDALDTLRRAEEQADALRLQPGVRSGLTLARADLMWQLNRREDAKALFTRAAELSDRSADLAGAAAAREGLGSLYLDEGDLIRATALLETALRAQSARQDDRAAALTRMTLAGLAARRGDTAGAHRLLSQSVAELVRLRDPVALAAVWGRQAELEAAGHRFAAAESLYRAALSRVGTRSIPDVTWQLHAGLAGARASLGAKDDAASELHTSIADIERVGRSLRLPERRSSALADEWQPYRALAELELGRGHIAESFTASEALRGRELAEQLSYGRVRAPRDTTAALIEREQDLRRRIAELAGALEDTVGPSTSLRGPELGRAGLVSREALLQTQAEYSALRLEIQDRAPRHAALLAVEPASWQRVAQRLRPDEVMLEYLLGDSGVVAYAITRDTLLGIPLTVSPHDLIRRVEFARAALQPRGSSLDGLWRAPLRQLYRDLLEAVEASGILAGKQSLIFVPHAELHYLPFAALIDRDGPPHYLIQRYQLSFAPSASVWLTLRDQRNSAGHGVLALAPEPERLPSSREEMGAIGSLEHGSSILVGKAATEAAFWREATGKRVIHFATYGVLNKQNPLFSFIKLAAGEGNDGRLEAHEVYGAGLRADLVVLAACQTALASGALTDIPPGDDWVGLTRAFLAAGAGHVMASLWAVQDRATADLMQRFYQRYASGQDAARGLAEAQRAMLAVPQTSHPFYWAAFEVIGGR